jgi:hypothetical protein
MNENTERIQQFKSEVAEMRLRDPATSLDRLFLWLGPVAMGAGILLGIVGYLMSHSTENPLQQRDSIILALIGLTVAVSGAAFFVKAAMANFLRFWLARLCYEQQAQADRVVAVVRSQNSDVESSSVI